MKTPREVANEVLAADKAFYDEAFPHAGEAQNPFIFPLTSFLHRAKLPK
jgi:hypothetical protein